MWVFAAGRFVVSQLAGTTLLWSVVKEHQQRRLFSTDLHNKTELHMKLWTSLVLASFLKSIVAFGFRFNPRIYTLSCLGGLERY